MSKKDKIKEKYAAKIEGDTIRIPPKAKYNRSKLDDRPLRVAAYCRVSTDSDEQATSLEAQRRHYEESIARHENWVLIEIYADEGISGTSTKRRDSFNRMIADAEAGKFDLIITKTVSRFTRNVVDGLVAARKLMEKSPPVGIYFEEDNINTLDPNSEFILTIMLSLAQGESAKKSETMQTSYKWRWDRKDFFCPTCYLLGYESDDNGDMTIEPEGAKTVRAIYTMYLAGMTSAEIALALTELGRPTGKNRLYWTSSSVMNIIRNEKYCGDIFGQKTYTVNFLEHKKAKNRGRRWLHYMSGHHEGIVTREEYIRALLMSNSNRKSKYFNPGYELRVIREGLLSGFIPINCAVGGYDAGHYLGASGAAKPARIRREVEIVNIEGAEVVRPQHFCGHTVASMTLSKKTFSFSRECTRMLKGVSHVEILLHPRERLLAVRNTTPGNRNAVPWRTGYVSSAAFMPVLFDLCGWHRQWKYITSAVCLVRESERVLFFDLAETETVVYKNMKDDKGKVIEKTSQIYMPPEWMDNFGKSVVSGFYSCRRHLAEALKSWLIDAPALPVSGFENTVALPDECNVKAAIQAMKA